MPRANCFVLAVDLEALVDVFNVAAHGVFADVEFVGDFFVVEAERDVVQNVDLSLGQKVLRRF